MIDLPIEGMDSLCPFFPFTLSIRHLPCTHPSIFLVTSLKETIKHNISPSFISHSNELIEGYHGNSIYNMSNKQM